MNAPIVTATNFPTITTSDRQHRPSGREVSRVDEHADGDEEDREKEISDGFDERLDARRFARLGDQ